MKHDVLITEVGPRDGLQNEAMPMSTADKLEMLEAIVAAGVQQYEIGSFVNPKAVPSMADTPLLCKQRPTMTRSRAIGLVMNERGFDAALEAGVDGVCIVTVISETLCLRNNNRTVQEALAMAQRLISRAQDAGLFVRVDVAPAWVCPFEGAMSLKQLLSVTDPLMAMNPDELALCDTIGHAQPFAVSTTFKEMVARYGSETLAAHFHDTKGFGLANATAALLQGVRRFDASLGGLGGCPFAPGARGNLASEDLVHLCEAMGLKTGIRLDKLWQAVRLVSHKLDRPLGGQSQRWWQSQEQELRSQL